MKDKIIEHFVNADADTMTNGLGWYQKAHEEAMVISQVFNKPLPIVIGVIAALSPRNKWAKNIENAWSLIEYPSMEVSCCTFNGQKQKAIDIINSDGTDETIMEILSGSKTVHFYHNIMYYHSSDVAVIDLWAFRSVEVEPSTKNFGLVHTAYKEAANDLGILPNQLQAVVWCQVRGEAG